MKKILGSYRIIYDNNVVQTLDLIRHEDYTDIIKVKEAEIYNIQKENKWKDNDTSKQIKAKLNDMFGCNYFTNKSPLYDAYFTGFLYSEHFENKYKKCKIISCF